MAERIKSKSIKVKSSITQLLKPSVGYKTTIKNIKVTNNTNHIVTFNIYLERNEKRYMYVKNQIIPIRSTSYEIPLKTSLSLEDDDILFFETTLADIDITCEYIEQPNILSKINIIFVNQKGEIVTNIIWKERDYIYDSSRKEIFIEENSKYSNIKSIYYKMTFDRLIVYKNEFIRIRTSDNIREYSDRYEILLRNYFKELINLNDICFLKVNFNILNVNQISPKWTYTNLITEETSDYFNNLDEVTLSQSDYRLTFSNLDDYEAPQPIDITLYNNNHIYYTVNCVRNVGRLKFENINNANIFTWKIFDGDDFSTKYDIRDIVDVASGEYELYVFDDDIEDEDHTTIYNLQVYPNCEHIVRHDTTEITSIKVSIDNYIDCAWKISEDLDFDDDIWYSNNYKKRITAGEYYIKYKPVEDYIEPEIQLIKIEANTQLVLRNRYINEKGKVSLFQTDVIDDKIKKEITWRLINVITDEKTEWYKYENEVEVKYGEYKIEFMEIKDYIRSFNDLLTVLSEQHTKYRIDNILLI